MEFSVELLTEMRDPEGAWYQVCETCLVSIMNNGDLEIPEDSATARLSQPIVANDPLERDAIWTRRVRENLCETLEEYQEKITSQEKVTVAPKQSHRHYERIETETVFSYTLARDTVSIEGTALDISRGGMRFITEHTLAEGQVITLDTKVFTAAKFKGLVRDTAEIRRVSKREDDTSDIGIRFVQRSLGKEPDRRAHSRIVTDLVVFYLRDEMPFITRGLVTNLSRGGIQLRLDEELQLGETIALSIRGEHGEFKTRDLDGKATVVHQKASTLGTFLVGCHLSDIVSTPRPPRAKEGE